MTTSSKNSETRNQHYVPQFILRNFCSAGKLWMFDKQSGNVFQTSPRNVMAERDFNSAKWDDVIVSFENRFEFYENNASRVIRKIVAQRSLLRLTIEEQADLHLFMITQHLRTKAAHVSASDVVAGVRQKAKDYFTAPFPLPLESDKHDKFYYLHHIFDSIDRYVLHLANKLSFIMVSDDNLDQIFISDSPFVLHNRNELSLGIGVAGIEIYHPLSSEVVLAYVCPTEIKRRESELLEIEKNVHSAFGRAFISKQVISSGERLQIEMNKRAIADAKLRHQLMTQERFVKMTREDKLYINQFQVSTSYRYIAAKKNDFRFIRSVLRERPNWR